MMKKIITAVAAILLLGGYFWVNSYTKKLDEKELKIETLKKEVAKLTLEKNNQESSVEESKEIITGETAVNEDFENFITDFINGMYDYNSNAERNENIKTLVTTNYYDLLKQYDSSTTSISKLKDVYFYKLTNESQAIVRVKYTYAIGEAKPNEFDLLVTLKVIKDSSGSYQVETQQNESIQYQMQRKMIFSR
ncbi:hypothetical protein AB6888_10510 [Carnobacterium maltaromaticum]|uniref:hypothetical protein n=1 Tax=Carnobacterium maltaromaticum TaxID=2751 RepID=UPI0039BE2436